MAGSNSLIKQFFNDKGLDLRSSDLVRSSEYASDILNTDYRKTGALNKRKGYHAKEESIGGLGMCKYSNVNLTTGDITEEIFTIDDNLHKLTTQNITITYTGSLPSRVSMFVEPTTSTFKFSVIQENNEILNYDLGVGINEASNITLANLKTQIDALTDFTMTISGDTSKPAAFIDITRDLPVTASGTIINYYEYSKVNAPLSSPFAGALANKNNDDFEIASYVNLNNILYIGNGYDFLQKYDGQNMYRAGMPAGVKLTTADNGAGNITNSSTTYIMNYLQFDNKGNLVEGNASEPSTALNLTSRQVDVTVTNIENTTGFNTNCAIVDGVQSGVTTINVDDGSAGPHTLKVGDTAYFYDGVTSSYVTREVTAITANTITIAGANVDVLDNAVISNNLRIAIYRNQSAGSLHFLVEEIPNNSFVTTQSYIDNALDSALGAEYIAPVKSHGLPPKGKYLTTFRNLLISCGDIANVNNVSFSDVDGPEYFPENDNQFLVDTRGDKITGAAANNNALFIFKEDSVNALTGDINKIGGFQVDEVVGGDVGCLSHHSIKEVRGKLVFISENGVYALTLGDNEPEELSYRINPIFNDFNDSNFNFNKAIALNWVKNNKYMLFLPSELDNSGDLYNNPAKSRVLVYDYSRKGWLKWDNLDMSGGMVILNDELYFTERRLGTVSNNVESYTYRIQDTGDSFDYADHNQGISFVHKTNWESMGEPDVFKKYLRLKVHSLDATINDFETDTFVLDVETQINYNNSESSLFSLDFGANTAGWSDFQWGIDNWGSVREIELKSKLKATKSRAMRIIFSNNNIHENILISGWTIEANLPFRVRLKE